MKKFNNVIRLLLVVLPFSLTSCEKLESEVKDFFGIDTDKDKQEEYVDSQTAMLQKVEAITKTVGEIYMESSSAAEMKSQSSVIKGIDGVESVWADDLTVFVKIKDFGTVPFVFTPLDNESNSYTRKAEEVAKTRATLSEEKIHNHLDLKEVCIVNQQYNDEDQELSTICAKAAEDNFRKCGFDVMVNNRPTVKFFAEDMLDYDLLYLITPGCYNERDGQHLLFTGEEIATSEAIDVYTLKNLMQNSLKAYSDGMVGIGALKEVRNGKKKMAYYLTVSEDLISKGSNKRFEKPALIYNSACQSVKHDANLAKAFIQKGAAVYLGYTEKNSVGNLAGEELCSRLLIGMPVGYIFESFPEEYLSEEIGGVTSKLKLYYNEAYNDSYALFCLQKPNIDRVYDNSNGVELKMSIMGSMKTPDGFNEDFLSYFTYGFCIGETPDFKDAKVLEGLKIGDAGINYANNQITFEQTFGDYDLEPSTDYYCWAYYYDGVNYCVSDSIMFTSPFVPAPSIDAIIPPKFMEYVIIVDSTIVDPPVTPTPDDPSNPSGTPTPPGEPDPSTPVYEGDNPPNVEDIFVLSPTILAYSTDNTYKPGDKFADVYFQFFDQDDETRRIKYKSYSKGNSGTLESEGDGVKIKAYVTGFRKEYFTVFLVTSTKSVYFDSTVRSEQVEIYSGKKTERGIENLMYCLLMIEKGPDPYGHVMPVGAYRKFYDGDGLTEYTNWPTYSRTRSERPKGTVIDTPWSIYSTGK